MWQPSKLGANSPEVEKLSYLQRVKALQSRQHEAEEIVLDDMSAPIPLDIVPIPSGKERLQLDSWQSQHPAPKHW